MEKGKSSSKNNTKEKKVSNEKKKYTINKKVLAKRCIQVVAIALIIVIICLIVSFISKGRNNKEDGGKAVSNNRVSEPGIVVEKDSSDGAYKNLVKALFAGGGDCNGIEEFANGAKVEANDISSSRAFYAALEDSFYNSSSKEISLKDMESAVKRLFGNDYEFKPEEIDENNCTGYEYKNGKFVSKKNTCKTSCKISSTKYEVVKVVEEYEKYTIDVKVLFGSNDDNNIAFYSDFYRSNLVTDNFNDAVKSINSGNTYRFIFGTEGNNYYYVSSEPVLDAE